MPEHSVEPSLREYLTLFLRRKYVVLAVFVLTTAAVVVATHFTPVLYTADTSLIVRFGREFTYRSEVAGSDSSKTFTLEEIVNSEVEILSSRDLAHQVVDEFGIEALYPEILEEPIDDEAAAARAAVKFQDHLNVVAVVESSVIRLSFAHTDPGLAARALNFYVERFKEKHLEVFGHSQAEFLQTQLEQYSARLAEAETDLHEFKTEHEIYDIDTQESAILGERAEFERLIREAKFRVSDLENKLEAGAEGIPSGALTHPSYSDQRRSLMARRNELGSLVQEARFRVTELRSFAGANETTSGRSSRGPVAGFDGRSSLARTVDEARLRLLDLELKERDLLRTHRRESREVQAVEEEIRLVTKFIADRERTMTESATNTQQAELRAAEQRLESLEEEWSGVDERLTSLDDAELSAYRLGLRTELSAAQNQLPVLQAELERTQQTLAEINSRETELHRLERAVAVHELNFQAVLTKVEEARTVKELDEQKIVSIRVVEKAAPPVGPSGLPKKIRWITGAIVGLGLGVAVALFLELAGL